jgi:exodeoxyribonuclease-3
MKLITWNCQMAFRRKAHLIELEQPDILIIPECEHPDKLLTLNLKPASVLWYGANKNKGLAVFSFGSYRLSSMTVHNPDLKLICPIEVTSGEIDFILFAVWANNPQDRDYQYIGQVWKAILYYDLLLKTEKIIIAGDFNSNVIWDKLHRKASHTMMVEKLESIEIFSTYHKHHNQIQGTEVHPTFHLYRHENKPYHIDYCFASTFFMKRLLNVKIGAYNDWTKHSDHIPLIVNFSF